MYTLNDELKCKLKPQSKRCKAMYRRLWDTGLYEYKLAGKKEPKNYRKYLSDFLANAEIDANSQDVTPTNNTDNTDNTNNTSNPYNDLTFDFQIQRNYYL